MRSTFFIRSIAVFSRCNFGSNYYQQLKFEIMKITSLLILFLLPFLCFAQLKENEKDNKTELVFENTPSKTINNIISIKDQILEEKYIPIKTNVEVLIKHRPPVFC